MIEVTRKIEISLEIDLDEARHFASDLSTVEYGCGTTTALHELLIKNVGSIDSKSRT